MRKTCLIGFSTAGFLLFFAANLQGQLPAFPEAEGFGRNATGGRGGRVIEVTNLLDKDRYGRVLPGTLREALNTAGVDPITIVFRV